MPDLEKVIKGLECCVNDGDCQNQCDEWPDNGCEKALMRDALTLLKAQEPVEPYMDYDGRDVWRCGNCGATIFHIDHTQADEDTKNYVKFCWHCGKAVKWNA